MAQGTQVFECVNTGLRGRRESGGGEAVVGWSGWGIGGVDGMGWWWCVVGSFIRSFVGEELDLHAPRHMMFEAGTLGWRTQARVMNPDNFFFQFQKHSTSQVQHDVTVL